MSHPRSLRQVKCLDDLDKPAAPVCPVHCGSWYHVRMLGYASLIGYVRACEYTKKRTDTNAAKK
jgi:hypothetical protein